MLLVGLQTELHCNFVCLAVVAFIKAVQHAINSITGVAVLAGELGKGFHRDGTWLLLVQGSCQWLLGVFTAAWRGALCE